ncbi:hypothetical protein GFY24_19510 [Nocardia sp. SYP-A9097]|uniref:hypothetical protein n=1 Tax=Nocardia sp. SYP-A9097 TaxID=2663237 RepID=UPI00129AA3C1|nr:hypothetical protein [Nocardia sp. SYP-A9097]MRH89604.1 hypothetical protein [Nocardia sp. SYP-A9097]
MKRYNIFGVGVGFATLVAAVVFGSPTAVAQEVAPGVRCDNWRYCTNVSDSTFVVIGTADCMVPVNMDDGSTEYVRTTESISGVIPPGTWEIDYHACGGGSLQRTDITSAFPR